MSREKELLERVLTSELWSVQEELQSEIRELLAELEQEDGYAWSSVADYEKEVGFKVNNVFKAAWDMARTRLSYESTTPAAQASLEQEPVAWIATNGKEPPDWGNYEYIWSHWKNGRISLDEAYGCWTWEAVTHWMPANIIEPSKPRLD
jgi:hypothetical protein